MMSSDAAALSQDRQEGGSPRLGEVESGGGSLGRVDYLRRKRTEIGDDGGLHHRLATAGISYIVRWEGEA